MYPFGRGQEEHRHSSLRDPQREIGKEWKPGLSSCQAHGRHPQGQRVWFVQGWRGEEEGKGKAELRRSLATALFSRPQRVYQHGERSRM